MKKITLLALFFSFFQLEAQFTLTNHETGNQINDGDVVTVSQDGFTTHVTATNTGSNAIFLVLDVISITNTDGSEMSYCFGVDGGGTCYFRMWNNDHHLSGNALSPGAHTQNIDDIDFTHTESTSGDFPNTPKDYVIKIYASDTNGGAQVGNAITFTYRYDPSAGIDSWLDSHVKYYVNNKNLYFSSDKDVKISIYSITGKQLKKQNIYQGNNEINLNDLSSGVYILSIDNNKNIYTRKFIIK